MENAPVVSNTPSQDERIMAALSHVSILLSLVGLVVPIVMWATQKDKSRYVAFQALQAIAFQLARMVVTFLGLACYMASAFTTVFGMSATSMRSGGFPAPMILPLMVLCLMGGAGLLFVIYGIAGAVMTLQGNDFAYIFIGEWVERFMEPTQKLR